MILLFIDGSVDKSAEQIFIKKNLLIVSTKIITVSKTFKRKGVNSGKESIKELGAPEVVKFSLIFKIKEGEIDHYSESQIQ